MEKFILNRLLDKYEKSRQASGESLVRRQISLKTKELPEYHGRELDYRKALHQAAASLEQQNLVRVEWLSGERDNLIRALHLNTEQLDTAYRVSGRSPKNVILRDLARQLTAIRPVRPWVQSFLHDCLDEVGKGRYPARLPRDAQRLDFLLSSLRGICANDEADESVEMVERIFSKRVLGHSKLFEQQVRTRLVGILRRYASLPELDEEDLLLLEAGLVRSTGEALLRGPLQILIKGRPADISPFVNGVALGPETLSEMEIAACAARRVISVENKATFRELVRAGLDETVLLVCLGGFAGSSKRRLLGKLAEHLGDQTEYMHWGDLDYGGLQIFQHLRQTCLPGLKPLMMDTATYEEFTAYGELFDEAYRLKLQRLSEQEHFSVFHEVLAVMLRQGKTLEQEAVPVERMTRFLR